MKVLHKVSRWRYAGTTTVHRNGAFSWHFCGSRISSTFCDGFYGEDFFAQILVPAEKQKALPQNHYFEVVGPDFLHALLAENARVLQSA